MCDFLRIHFRCSFFFVFFQRRLPASVSPTAASSCRFVNVITSYGWDYASLMNVGIARFALCVSGWWLQKPEDFHLRICHE